MKVIKTLAYAALLLAILTGNSLVVLVISRNRKLRTIVSYFILNMAISDLLIPLFALPVHIQHIYLPWGVWLVDGEFASITCKLMPFAENTSITVSVLILELIAIDRFFCVVFPTKKQPINSKRRCLILIAICWLIALLFSTIFLYKRRIVYKDKTPYCKSSWEPAFDNAEGIKIQFPITLAVLTMVPFLLLTSLYTAIVITLHRQKAKLHLAPEAKQRKDRKYRQVTYMLVTVVAVFLVSWLPINIYWFLMAYAWKTAQPCQLKSLIFAADFLSYTYPAINPFIYCFFMEDYKNGFRELLCCLTPGKTSRKNKHSSEAIETSKVGASKDSKVVFL